MNTQYIKYLLLPTALFSTVAMAQEENAEMVNVAFRQVPAEDLLGGVSVLNYEELTDKNYNTYSLDNMQGYIGGFNGASLWGKSDYLVLVDGVPRDANNVKPEEIASITFMKSAQAVILYGSRAAKGAILISTKRGEKKDMEIKVHANTNMDMIKSLPKYLGSAEYMTLYNEAMINDGQVAKYSDAEIYNYYAGTNPYRYANVDMYSSDYIKKTQNRWEVSTEIQGGGERAHYYTNIGYFRQGDYLNFGKAKNNYSDRINVRGNVDINFSDWIKATVDANVTMYGQKTTRGGNYWSEAATFRPNYISPLIPIDKISEYASGALEVLSDAQLTDGDYILGGYSSIYETNVFADIYRKGNNKYNARHMEFATGFDFDLAKILNGLSFHTQVAVDYATEYTTYFDDSYATYQAEWSNMNGKDEITGLTKILQDKHTGIQSMSGSTYKQTIAFNAHFDYDRVFNENHNVSAMLLANGFQQALSANYHNTSNANLGLQVNYNYAHKYFVELGSAMVHTAKLAPGHRNGFNYAVTAGWNAAKESWMEGTIFNDLTLSAGIAQLNQDMDIKYDGDEYYLYAGNYVNTENWYGWEGAGGAVSVQSNRGANESLDFIKHKEQNAAIRAALLDNSLKLNAAVFSTSIEGMLYRPTTVFPNYFTIGYPETSFIPIINYENDKRMGFEVGASYNKKFGEFELGVGANVTYYKTEMTRRDDSGYADAYQHRTGKAIDTIWGLEFDGFFASQDECDQVLYDKDNNPDGINYAFGETPKPGDMKYKDQNGDGVIDNKDQVDLGVGGWYGNPWTFGINLTAKYKGFTLFVLGVGGMGAKGIKDNSYWRLSGDSKYSAVARGRCIVKDGKVTNLDTATYPRLTTGAAANNFQTSDFWLYKTDRFDIAKIQLSYDCPSQWFQSQKVVKGVSAFVNGSNLLTIAPEKEILEMNVGSAPQSRTVMAGVNVTF